MTSNCKQTELLLFTPDGTLLLPPPPAAAASCPAPSKHSFVPSTSHLAVDSEGGRNREPAISSAEESNTLEVNDGYYYKRGVAQGR